MTITGIRGSTTSPIFNTTPTGPLGAQTTAPSTSLSTTQGGTVPVGGGNVVNAKPVTSFGLNGTSNSASGTMSRFSRDASFDTYSGVGDAPVSRGFVKIDAQPIQNGCRIEVNSFHGTQNDKVSLYLIGEVLDTQTNQMRTITISVLAQSQVLNGGSFRGKSYFDLNYDDVNKWLQAKNPALKLVPGHTNLAVSARWDIGHQAGGFARGGAFRIPPALGASSVTALRAGGVSAATTEQTDLPLDMQVAFPAALQQQIPMLKAGGSVQSRLESELKGNTSKKDMVKAVHEMYRLAELSHSGNDREIEKLLGKDWTIETVNRYWLKDDGNTTQGSPGTGYFKGFRVDKEGLPIQDPMRDSYMDDGNLMMTRHEGAIRLRSNQQANVVNVKPGGGRRDPQTQITQRIEVGIELNAAANTAQAAQAMTQLSQGQWGGTVFNHAQKEVSKLDATLNLSSCLVPWLDVTQDRHKFTVKNKKTGVEIELSLDFVKAKTLRPGHADANGAAREVEFCTLEAELDHLQLQSANQSTYVAAGSVNQQVFTDDNSQDAWLKQTTSNVTMDIDPRLHELKDLDNKSFRSTGSYKSFEGVTAKLVPALFSNGLGEGRQKAAHAADLLGLVSFDDAKLTKHVHKAIEDAGFVVTPALTQQIDAAIKVPRQRLLLDQGLSSGASKNIVNWLTQGLGAAPAMEYDLPKAKSRLANALNALGFVGDASATAILDNMTVQNLPPATFEQLLAMLPRYNEAQALTTFTQYTRATPPALKTDVGAYLKRAEVEAAMVTALDAAAVDKASVKDVAAFFVDAHAKGLTLLEVRQQLGILSSQPQVRLQQVAQARGLTAPVLKANVDALARQLEPYLKQQQLVMTPSLKKLLEKVATSRDVTQAQAFVQSLAANAVDVANAEAKRIGAGVVTLDRDWPAIEAALTPTLKQQHVLYDADLQKMVKAAIEAGVPVALMQRAFQYLGSQTLPQALKTAGIYLVGVKIPDLAVDKATLSSSLQANYAGYTGVFPSWTKFVDDSLKAGLSAGQVVQYAAYVTQQGSTAAARYYPTVMNLPDANVDVAALATFLGARWGAQWTPATDAFVKANFAAASSSVAVTRLYQLRPHDVAVAIATAAKVPLPPGV